MISLKETEKNMNEEVTVKVTGVTRDAEGTENTIEQINKGIYSERAGKKYLMYYEKQEESDEEVKSLVTLDGNQVIVSKTGSVNTRMIFAAGKKNCIDYQTRFGRIQMDVFTKNLMVICKEESVQITIDYNLEIGNDVISECRIDIIAIKK